MRRALKTAGRTLRTYLSDEGANSAAELALWVAFMIFPFMNAVDIGYYMFQAMQVRAAAQAAVQTAQVLCGQTAKFPVASNCTGLTDQMKTSVKSTLLGSKVSLTTGTTAGGTDSAPFEDYYCSDATGTLVQAKNSGGTTISPWFVNGGIPSPSAPPSCSYTGLSNTNTGTSADYVIATVTYAFTPLFQNVSLLGLFNSTGTIKKTAWMRVA